MRRTHPPPPLPTTGRPASHGRPYRYGATKHPRKGSAKASMTKALILMQRRCSNAGEGRRQGRIALLLGPATACHATLCDCRIRYLTGAKCKCLLSFYDSWRFSTNGARSPRDHLPKCFHRSPALRGHAPGVSRRVAQLTWKHLAHRRYQGFGRSGWNGFWWFLSSMSSLCDGESPAGITGSRTRGEHWGAGALGGGGSADSPP